MRIQSLDGVRALLALWVVFGHLAKMVHAEIPLVGNPAVAVDLFMMLSGFFIAATYTRLTQQYPAGTAARYFLVRRVMRIWPVYAVLLTLVWLFLEPLNTAKLVSVYAFSPPDVVEAQQVRLPYAEPTVLAGVLHYTMLFGLVPSQATTTPLPDWSLSLEFQFYLLFPLLAVVLQRRSLLLCFVAAALAFVSPKLLGEYLEPGRFAHFRQPAFLAYKLNFFLLGALAYRVFTPQRDGAGLARSNLELLAIVLCVVAMGAQATLGIFGVLYLLAQPRSMAANVLSGPLMSGLGRISFSIYLVHMPLLIFVVAVLVEQPWFLALPALARYAVAITCLLPPVILAAQLLHWSVEVPGIGLAHRWTSGGRSSDRVPSLSPEPTAAVVLTAKPSEHIQA